MAPFKSSLARSGKKLLGLFNQKDLTLRGATQSIRDANSTLNFSIRWH